MTANMIPDLPIEMKKNLSELTILVGAATFLLGGIYFLPDPKKYESNIAKILGQSNRRVIGVLNVGLVITAAGLIIGTSSPENRPDDIDHTQKNIEQLEAALAALQTKTPNSPEATVETKS